MQVVILAAGRGKRMGNLTKAQAKPMLKIKGKPILEYKINALPKKIKEIVFIVGYHSMSIISHFKHYFGGRKITYVFQENLNGTGGALHLAKSILRDKFLVMMGDDLYQKKDLSNLLQHDLAILSYETNNPSRFGVIITDKRRNLAEVVEKPKNFKKGLVNTGVYILNKNFFDYDLVPIGGGEYGLPQTLAQMADKYRIKVERATAWQPIGCPDDLTEASKVLHKFL